MQRELEEFFGELVDCDYISLMRAPQAGLPFTQISVGLNNVVTRVAYSPLRNTFVVIRKDRPLPWCLNPSIVEGWVPLVGTEPVRTKHEPSPPRRDPKPVNKLAPVEDAIEVQSAVEAPKRRRGRPRK